MCSVFCNSIVRLVVLGFPSNAGATLFYEGRAYRPLPRSVRAWTIVSISLTHSAARLRERFPPSSAPFFHQSQADLCLSVGAEVPYVCVLCQFRWSIRLIQNHTRTNKSLSLHTFKREQDMIQTAEPVLRNNR